MLFSALVAQSATATATDVPNPAEAGQFSAPFSEIPLFAERPPASNAEASRIPTAVSAAMLPDGRIIYWGGLEGIENAGAPIAADGGRTVINSRTRILDLRDGTPKWSTPSPEDGAKDDLFCADQRLLVDGRLLAVGGTVWKPDPVDLSPATGEGGPGGTVELFGSDQVTLFDPATEEWTRNAHMMANPRWYPTATTMGNGKILIVSGVARLIYNFSGLNVQATETFDPATGSVTDNGQTGSTSLPLFARMHLLPDGKVFYDGVGQMWGPFGQSADEALWAFHKAYDPQKKTWTNYGMGSYGARSGALSVLLPLKPPYKEARILIAGGTLGSSPGSYLANDLTEIVTVADGASTSETGPALNNRRWYSSSVLLPDGNVVALSGADRDEVILPGSETPVTEAEIFDGESWTSLASAHRIRTYHNSAMLLPDGSILVGGHAPINTGYGGSGDNSAQPVTGTNNFKDPSFEIFKPPYLFRGPRSTITHVQKGIAWGNDFKVTTPDASDVKKVVLMHMPAVTHITDADQRSIELDFDVASNGTLNVKAPPSGNVAPPGYYYLFLMTDNGEGLTPSNARILRVWDNEIQSAALAPMGP
ncbi:MAG: hypothetical protein QOK47_1122 [Actinomycetota bacterium]|nr:hypothetical protein [Actinomycetota bacterium]